VVKKIVSPIMMILLVLSMFTLLSCIQSVRAQGTIYINADGSISPSTAPIYTADNITYTLTGNISADADGIHIERSNIVIDGSGYTVQGTLYSSNYGIYLDGVSNVTIKNTTIEAFYYSIWLWDASGNTISGNNVTGPNSNGITLYGLNNTVCGNNITNAEVAVMLEQYSNYDSINGNNITGGGMGIFLDGADYNNIDGNNITTGSSGGIYLQYSNNNNISGNDVTNNEIGIDLLESYYNTIYHNNFSNNAKQVYDASWDYPQYYSPSINVWNNGYPSGGNYWSDYTGVDLYSGPYQNITGKDGIGDTPYTIDANNTDNYPLMAPFVPFDNQTIYINADGRVDPSGAPILRNGDLYTLTGNINSISDGIVIEKDNIVLDGAGFTVQGNGTGNGIDLSGRENVTVRNTQITAFECCIYLDYCSNSSISGNNITNSWWGINSYPYPSDHNSIDGNNITNNYYGMELLSSPYSSVSGNNIAYNEIGIRLDYSSNCSISGNTFTADGLFLWDSYLNSVENNIVNGKPLVYLEGVAGYSVSDAGQVILVNCDSMRVENLNLSLSTIGLQLLKTNNTVISGNNITYNSVSGIFLDSSSSYDSIIGNTITGNWIGIWLNLASYNGISENNITGDWFGIWLTDSLYDNISGNKIVASARCGIDLQSSSSNSIIGNTITANDYYGILLWYSSNYNSIIGNNITANNGFGIYLDSSTGYLSYNSIFHNNFINNTNQVYSSNSANVWDDGYPSGGNYWSDYNGTDSYSGAYQNVTGSDGIGDTPYVIDANNTDNYPLMNPYSTLSITILPASSTFDVGQSQTFNSTVSGGTLPYTYQWCLNGTAVPDGNFSSWAFTPSAGSYMIYANVTDSVGVQATSNTATVTVNAAPSVTILPGSATLDGQSQTFNSTVSGGTYPYYYQWYLDGLAVSGATYPTWVFAPASAGSYTVYLNVTDSVGVIAISDNATVNVYAGVLTVSISPTSATMELGLGLSQLFTSTVSGGTLPYTYQWYLNGAAVQDATFNNWIFTPTSSGSCTVYLNVTDSVGVIAISNTATVQAYKNLWGSNNLPAIGWICMLGGSI
jgi:parallel beta-helix repeat protein